MNDNRDNGSGPSEPGDTPDRWTGPTPDRPWRPVPDEASPLHLFDHGQPWCAQRYLHPEYHGGYPGIDHHPSECQSYGGAFQGWFEDARSGLYGPPGFLSCYLALPFRFGQSRYRPADDDRLALEFLPQEQGAAEPFRCSIPATSIRNLAAHLTQTADVGDGWREPRKVRRSLTD